MSLDKITDVMDIRSVSYRFGKVNALQDMSLSLGAGEIVGIVGPKGAGKSTLLRLMRGELQADSGEVFVLGASATSQSFGDVHKQIGFLPEVAEIYDNLSGEDTLIFSAQTQGIEEKAARAQCLEVLQIVGLADVANLRVRKYSRSMRQRLGLAQALLGNPQILLLDEPFRGLIPEEVQDFFLILEKVRSRGVSIVFTTHAMKDLDIQVERLLLLRQGKILGAGNQQELLSQVPVVVELTVLWSDRDMVRRNLKRAGFNSISSMEGVTVFVSQKDKTHLQTFLLKFGDKLAHTRLIQITLDELLSNPTVSLMVN